MWINDALAPIPEDFSGRLLEVPVGTGVLTIPLCHSLRSASVTCLDYSADMMARAENRAKAMNISRVSFVRGDVGVLPLRTGALISFCRSTAFTRSRIRRLLTEKPTAF